MAAQYLIDTSAAIKYLNGTLPNAGIQWMDAQLEKGFSLSVITEIELQVWNPLNPHDLEIYTTFIGWGTVLGITPEIVKETIAVRKHFRLKLPDALIAATALQHDLLLIADNDKDFSRIPQLQLDNPRYRF